MVWDWKMRMEEGRIERVLTNLLIIQPVRRDPIVFPTIDGSRCREVMMLDARCLTRKYNATEENICIVRLVLKQAWYHSYETVFLRDSRSYALRSRDQ